MFNCGNGYSVADMAAVMGNRNGYGYGMDGAWWVWILLFGLWGGNGGYGWGNGAGAAAATQADIQRGFDTQSIMGSLRGIEQGICSLGYDQLAQMNGINTNVMQTGFGIQQAINSDTIANMQNTNALSRQIADCCCGTTAAIKDVQYNMATLNCATNNTIHQTGDAILGAIKDGFCNLEMREMQRENANLRQQLNECDRDKALQGTASYIIESVRPTAKPAWWVPNPFVNYGPYDNTCYGNNWNSGCGNQGRCCNG